MTISAPTLFPFKHDWGEPFRITREWKTDVQTADDGSEVRAQLRTYPTLSVSLRLLWSTEMGAGRLLAQWRGAAQPLRYYAPLWCDVTDLTDAVTAGDAIIQLDTMARPLFALPPSGIGYAMLWRSEEFAEVVSYSVEDSLLVLDAGTVNSYAVAGTRVVPVRPMWLQRPVAVTWLSGRVATVDLSFTDQKEHAGLGLDGSATLATPASVRIYAHSMSRATDANVLGFAPFYVDLEAMPFDALGVPLPSSPVDWSSTEGATVTPTINTRFASVYVLGDAMVTATAGAASDEFEV
jgi:hypothetical protein